MSRWILGVTAAVGMVAIGVAADHTTDTLDTVKANVAAGKAILVDVREEGEWKDGHLKGARHLALSELKAGVPAEKLKNALPAGKVVYLHCASGRRCLKAGELLKKQGYDARPLKAGYETLLKSGFEKAK